MKGKKTIIKNLYRFLRSVKPVDTWLSREAMGVEEALDFKNVVCPGMYLLYQTCIPKECTSLNLVQTLKVWTKFWMQHTFVTFLIAHFEILLVKKYTG